MTPYHDHILDMASRLPGRKPSAIGPELSQAIIEAANTRNAGNRELYDAANAIIDAMPGEFVLTGARQAI